MLRKPAERLYKIERVVEKGGIKPGFDRIQLARVTLNQWELTILLAHLNLRVRGIIRFLKLNINLVYKLPIRYYIIYFLGKIQFPQHGLK